jgi:hypothetical protein
MRNYKNWLETFIGLYRDISPAPLSFLEWSGMFCIASVVKRKVEFSREYLKSFRIFPNLYVIFVSPPGVAHKSTTAGLGVEVISEMLKGLPITDPAYVNFAQSSGSHIGIVESMMENIDGSASLVLGEFGTIAAYTPVETFDFLAHMFDSDKIAEKYVHRTRKKGVEAIVKPSVNILGCTTPGWLAANAGYMIGGGFAARVVFVFESRPRYRRLFSKGFGPSVKEQEAIKKKLAKDLRHIGSITGEAVPESDELADEINEWYSKIENFQGDRGTETFQARKHVHVLRNTMLLSLAERDDLVITRDHFHRALKQVKDVESKLGRGLSIFGKNPYSSIMYDVLEYVKENGPIERGKIMARFWTEFERNPDQDLGMILDTLKAMGEVKEIIEGNKSKWVVK